MEILFLGTGAADWPKDKDIHSFSEYRRNASALIDDVLLIDPGPFAYDAVHTFGGDAKTIKYIINTHKHDDHYNISTIEKLEKAGARFIPMEKGQTVTLGKYTVRALEAHHGTVQDAVHFLISDGTSRMFYGLDGAWLLYDEVQAIKEAPVDFAVLDATVGFIEGDYRVFEHNNLHMVIEMKKALAPHVKRFCISHMAYTLHTDHKTLASDMEKYGIEVAYDGMETDF